MTAGAPGGAIGTAPAVPPSRGPFAVPARIRSGWYQRSRQERLALRLLLPVFGLVFVAATIPFVLAVVQRDSNSPQLHDVGSREIIDAVLWKRSA